MESAGGGRRWGGGEGETRRMGKPNYSHEVSAPGDILGQAYDNKPRTREGKGSRISWLHRREGGGEGGLSQTQMGHNLWPDPDLWHLAAAKTLLAQVSVFSPLEQYHSLLRPSRSVFLCLRTDSSTETRSS